MASMKKLRWTLYITGGILIALGLWSLSYPLEALLSLAFALGLGFCLSGINYLVPCLSLRGDCLYPRWFLVLGILDLLMGVIMLARLGLTAFMIPVAAGAWLFFVGLVRIATSIRLRGIEIDGVRAFPRWWLMLLNGVLVVLISCLMAASPLVAAGFVVTILACSLVASGLLFILEGRVIFTPVEAE